MQARAALPCLPSSLHNRPTLLWCAAAQPHVTQGDAVKTHNYSRREFVGMSAAAGASLAANTLGPLPPHLVPDPGAVAASDRVRFGMIGVGMQGSGLLSQAITLPGVECAAACDLYDGRHTLAREIVRADLPVTRRYQALLDDKSIDCIVAAVPDHWHKQVVVDAVSAGKDIYCEKPMSHTAADGVAMVDAVKPTNRIVQIGSQRVSSQICAKARELIAQGAIGELMMVEGSLGRNDPTGAWEYPPLERRAEHAGCPADELLLWRLARLDAPQSRHRAARDVSLSWSQGCARAGRIAAHREPAERPRYGAELLHDQLSQRAAASLRGAMAPGERPETG